MSGSLAAPASEVSGDLVGAGSEPAVTLHLAFAADRPGDERSGRLEVPLRVADDGLARGAFDVALELAGSGVLTLAVEGATAAPMTFLLNEAPRTVPVLYVGPGNAPLRRALLALGHVELREIAATGAAPAALLEDAAAYSLVILDRVTVGSAPRTSTLWLGSARLAADEMAAEEAAGPAEVTRWLEDHPLTASVDWGRLELGRAWHAQPLPGATELVGGMHGPLAQVRRTAAGLELHLHFDPTAGNWPTRNSFPVFVRDLVRLIDPAAGRRVEPGCEVGFACRLPSGTSGVSDPRGRAVPLARSAYGGAEVLADGFVPRLAGVHLLESASGPARRLAVNAFVPVARDAPGAPAGAADGSAGTHLRLRHALLAALLLVLGAEAWVGRAPRRRRLLLLRLGVLLLVGLAAFDLRLPLPAHSGRLVVLLPGGPWRSGEVEGWRQVADDLERLEGVGAAVVVTDGPPAVATLDATATPVDLQGALELALAHATPDEPARIVLVGDGAQTVGEYGAALAAPRAPGVRVDALPLARAPAGELAVRSVRPPDVVLAGDRFALSTVLHATHAGAARVTTFRDGAELEVREVELLPGDNRLELLVSETAPGEVLYEVAVGTGADAFGANDRAGAYVTVRPAARVLLVAPEAEWGGMLAAALAAQGVEATLVDPGRFPASLDALLGYGAVALMNVPATALSTGQQELLEAATREHGRALLLLGGENAFGPGGYYETPLERLSPTSSLVPREAPELALAFVLDRSNSMRQYAGDSVRLDIAKVAVSRAHGLLPEGARAALIAFDSTARTLVPLGSAQEGEAFRAAVSALEPRGGTSLYPALVAAYEQLAGSGAAASHVIVMSDGLSQPGDFPGILALLRAEGITVSTIAIGPEADADQLREIAVVGGGTFHASVDFDALPGIMSHEVLLHGGDLTEERDATPAWHDRSAPFLGAWPERLPAVEGFVPTTLKPEATLHLSVTADDGTELPLLSSWRYGAGQVVAFTAHGAGPWTRPWLELADFPLLWSHLVRQLVQPPQEAGSDLELTRRGDVLRVEVGPGVDGAADYLPELILSGPDGARTDLAARPLDAGRYAGEALLGTPGTYTLTATSAGESVTRSFRHAYPAALDFGLADLPRLAAATVAAGGSVLPSLADVGPVRGWHWSRGPAWPWLCLLAVLFLLLELTLRYAPDLLASRRKD